VGVRGTHEGEREPIDSRAPSNTRRTVPSGTNQLDASSAAATSDAKSSSRSSASGQQYNHGVNYISGTSHTKQSAGSTPKCSAQRTDIDSLERARQSSLRRARRHIWPTPTLLGRSPRTSPTRCVPGMLPSRFNETQRTRGVSRLSSVCCEGSTSSPLQPNRPASALMLAELCRAPPPAQAAGPHSVVADPPTSVLPCRQRGGSKTRNVVAPWRRKREAVAGTSSLNVFPISSRCESSTWVALPPLGRVRRGDQNTSWP